MDSHVVYQAVPIDLNEYFSSSGPSSLLPTFGGNRNNRDDDDNRKKLYLLGGLVVALILLLAIVLPIVHHHHKSEQLHLFVTDMTNTVGNDHQGEPRVSLKPRLENDAITQEEHASNNFFVPMEVDNVVNDDETMFWRLDYLGDDKRRFDPVDYIHEEEWDIHAEVVHGHPGDAKLDGQDRYLEDEDDDDEMFPEYHDVVPLDEDEDEEFETHRDALAVGIKDDASPKLLFDDEAEQHAMAY